MLGVRRTVGLTRLCFALSIAQMQPPEPLEASEASV